MLEKLKLLEENEAKMIEEGRKEVDIEHHEAKVTRLARELKARIASFNAECKEKEDQLAQDFET
jgi:hypothetical protein